MTEWRENQWESMLLDRQNGVSEMAEHYEKVWCDIGRPLCRPGIEWRVPDVPDTILEEHALEFGFCFNSGTHLTTIFRPL